MCLQLQGNNGLIILSSQTPTASALPLISNADHGNATEGLQSHLQSHHLLQGQGSEIKKGQKVSPTLPPAVKTLKSENVSTSCSLASHMDSDITCHQDQVQGHHHSLFTNAQTSQTVTIMSHPSHNHPSNVSMFAIDNDIVQQKNLENDLQSALDASSLFSADEISTRLSSAIHNESTKCNSLSSTRPSSGDIHVNTDSHSNADMDMRVLNAPGSPSMDIRVLNAPESPILNFEELDELLSMSGFQDDTQISQSLGSLHVNRANQSTSSLDPGGMANTTVTMTTTAPSCRNCLNNQGQQVKMTVKTTDNQHSAIASITDFSPGWAYSDVSMTVTLYTVNLEILTLVLF